MHYLKKFFSWYNKAIVIAIISIIFLNGKIIAESKLDSLIHQLDKSISDSEKINLYIDIINLKLDILDKDNIEFLDKAFVLISKYKNKEKFAEISQLYGIYWKNINSEKSIDYLLKALTINEKLKKDYNIAENYKNLGESYRTAIEYEQSLKYLFKAKEIFEEIDDTLQLALTLNRIAAVYYEQPTDSLKFISIGLAKESNSLVSMNNSNEVGLIISNINIIGANYRCLIKYSLAEQYLFKALEISETTKEIYNRATILNNIIHLLREQGKLKQAIEYAHKYLDFTGKNNLTFLHVHLYDILAITYSEIENFEKAYYYKSLSTSLRIELFYKERNNKILELQAKYDLVNKEHELAEQKLIQSYQLLIFIVFLSFLIGITIILITKRKTTEKTNKLISEQNKKLSELNATKDKFFSIIAHDLKNPIISFTGLLDLMVDEPDSLEENEGKEFLTLMRKSAHHLSDLLENLLTWSKTQGGHMACYPVDIYVDDLITSNISLHSLQAAKKNIKIKSYVENNLVVNADINMINTVLRNLISNAIKFTPDDGIISINVHSSDNEVIFEVSDNGVGMDTITLNKLFDIGSTQSSLGTNNEKGTGLGLIICKEFIGNNFGKISVKSELGEGTTFAFTLPKAKS